MREQLTPRGRPAIEQGTAPAPASSAALNQECLERIDAVLGRSDLDCAAPSRNPTSNPPPITKADEPTLTEADLDREVAQGLAEVEALLKGIEHDAQLRKARACGARVVEDRIVLFHGIGQAPYFEHLMEVLQAGKLFPYGRETGSSMPDHLEMLAARHLMRVTDNKPPEEVNVIDYIEANLHEAIFARDPVVRQCFDNPQMKELLREMYSRCPLKEHTICRLLSNWFSTHEDWTIGRYGYYMEFHVPLDEVSIGFHSTQQGPLSLSCLKRIVVPDEETHHIPEIVAALRSAGLDHVQVEAGPKMR